MHNVREKYLNIIKSTKIGVQKNHGRSVSLHINYYVVYSPLTDLL